MLKKLNFLALSDKAKIDEQDDNTSQYQSNTSQLTTSANLSEHNKSSKHI